MSIAANTVTAPWLWNSVSSASQFVGVVGPVGSGKSSLLAAIAGEMETIAGASKLAPGAVVVVLDPVVVQVPSPDAGGDGYAAVHCGDAAKILLDGKPLPTVLRATSSSTTN